MKRLLFLMFCFFTLLYFVVPEKLYAAENPLSSPNNKLGIHILFTSELQDAAKLINSSGGDWGYVVIPIQSGDRDLEKWQKFMDEANSSHVIPILRLATEGDYFNTKVWRKPNFSDILDFANFLSSLSWPIKNRYIIVFNETNRADEWGGTVSPSEYARILSYASTVFKSKNSDFFILSAGLDNAAPTVTGEFMNEYNYLREMASSVPEVFNQVDGLSSHSYPNPGFSKPPSKQDEVSIASFRFERNLVKTLSGKDLPVFITETGWSENFVTESVSADYYNEAFNNVWNDEEVVAVTPFLLRAGPGPFEQFSFFKADGGPKKQYETIINLHKTKGLPLISPSVLGKQTMKSTGFPVKNFSGKTDSSSDSFSVPESTKKIIKWLLKL